MVERDGANFSEGAPVRGVVKVFGGRRNVDTRQDSAQSEGAVNQTAGAKRVVFQRREAGTLAQADGTASMVVAKPALGDEVALVGEVVLGDEVALVDEVVLGDEAIDDGDLWLTTAAQNEEEPFVLKFDSIPVASVEPLRLEHPLAQKARDLAALASASTVEEGVLVEVVEVPNLLEGEPDLDMFELLQDKSREFAFLGYENIRPIDIWKYFQQLKKNRPRRLHELVGAILALQVQAIKNYDLQKAASRGVSESLEDLLNDIN